MGRSRKNNKLAKVVRNIILEEHAPILADISFRLGQLHETAGRQLGLGTGTVYAEDMNTSQHMITGFTVTNNAPTAGSISWADLHIVYNGVDHAITNGSTALKYIYFTLATTPTVLKFSADKPTLAEGDILLFVNEGGVARNMLSQTNQTMPRLVATNAIDTDAIAPLAVTGESLAANAVGVGKIADGAINKTSLINGKIVGTAQLVNNAVTGDILGAGSINNSNKFGTGKIIPGGQIVDNSVTGPALGTGAVTPNKLNILQHVLY